MPPRKKPTNGLAEFDLSLFQEPKDYVWREIERDGRDPLRVKLQDLSIRQTRELAFPLSTPMSDVYEVIAPYVVAWSFELERIDTGELSPCPSPAEAGGAVFEYLPNEVAVDIYFWLKNPQVMKAAELKKSQTPSTSTTDPPSSND